MCAGLTVARVYCNRQDEDAFTHIWTAYFDSVKQATGERIKILRFDKEGQLLAIIVDGDVAQYHGLGHYLKKHNNALKSSIYETRPSHLAMYLGKTCQIHYNR